MAGFTPLGLAIPVRDCREAALVALVQASREAALVALVQAMTPAALTVVADVTAKTPKTPKTLLRREKTLRRVGPRGSFEQFERPNTSNMLRNNLKYLRRLFS